MCELFAVCSKLPTTVTFSLDEFASHGGTKGAHVDGWGIAFYQDNDVQLIRETSPASKSEYLQFVRDHQTASTLVLSHLRKANRGSIALKNTQPFARELCGRMHLFAHNGFLDEIDELKLSAAYVPIGETDSEIAFCYLMDRLREIWQTQPPPLATRIDVIRRVFESLAHRGPANFLYSDAEFLYAYGNKRTKRDGEIKPPGLYYVIVQSCLGSLSSSGFSLSNCPPDAQQSIVMIASVPLTADAWIPLDCSEFIVAQHGTVIHRETLSTEGNICQPLEL